jgi:hypothetical protein
MATSATSTTFSEGPPMNAPVSHIALETVEIDNATIRCGTATR